MKLVRIPDPEKVLKRFPHELSGGMRQRVMIAMALALKPSLIIADEPTTALDVSTQAQVLKLMKKLVDELNTSAIFITHDLGVISEIADRVLVMYAGRIVEEASVYDLFENPLHPYTQGLLKSFPSQKTRKKLDTIPGNVPNLLNLPSGCPFHPRCKSAIKHCSEEVPKLREVKPGHKAACILYD